MDRELLRANLALFAFGLTKIPLIAFIGARWVALDEQHAVVKVPLNFRTRNHVKSMYFGAMAIGADLVIGGLAWYHIRRQAPDVYLMFKDFKAEYLKRAEADVQFVCEHGDVVKQLVLEAARTGERVNATIPAYAIVPDKFGSEPIAQFALTLSLRRRA
jgi:acyl-coenzyme A thioesterase PaaI-like protein